MKYFFFIILKGQGPLKYTGITNVSHCDSTI